MSPSSNGGPLAAIGAYAVLIGVVVYTMWAAILAGLALGVAYMVVCSTAAWRLRQSELMWLLGGQLALWGAAWLVRPWVDDVALLTAYMSALVAAILVEVLAPASWRPPTSSLSSRRLTTIDLGSEIEAQGWEEWAAAHALELVAESPDPGNPGQVLTLLSVPAAYGPWRVVEATDGTSGERVGLVVPGRYRDPVRAVAWTYGVDAGTYRATVART